MPNKKRIRHRIKEAKAQKEGGNHHHSKKDEKRTGDEEFEKVVKVKQDVIDTTRAACGPHMENMVDLGLANAKARNQTKQVEMFEKVKKIQSEAPLKTMMESLLIDANDGELLEPYGDGDQSLVYGNESILLRTQWGSGADYNPGRLSEWGLACYFGLLDEVQTFVEEDKTILDYRESILRVCGILHVIIGARCLEGTPPPGSDHEACLEYLIAEGADIQCHDFAGHSPLHHCLTSLGNDLSFKLAKILLKHGANPNAINRFGATPLHEPSMNGNLKFVKLLLDHGAKINKKDNDGCMPFTLAKFNPALHALFSEYMTKQGKAQKAAAKANSSYRKCAFCGVDKNCSRCSGCYVRWYCTVECQREDWSCHRNECKMTQAEYKKVTIVTEVPGKTHLNLNYKTRKINKTKLDLTKKQHLLVKLSIPIPTVVVAGMWSEEKDPILIYDKEKLIMGYILPTEENYDDIVNIVQEKGVSGLKGYFYAILKDNEVEVNISKIQPPEGF